MVRAVETEEEVAVRSFGSVLHYQCGLARRFLDQETEMHYDIREMECHWNQVTLSFYPQRKFNDLAFDVIADVDSDGHSGRL